MDELSQQLSELVLARDSTSRGYFTSVMRKTVPDDMNTDLDIYIIPDVGVGSGSWWTTNLAGVSLLHDWLQRDFPRARVMSYGYTYNSAYASIGGTVGLESLASDLVKKVLQDRAQQTTRPLIFLGCIFGSMLVKKTLWLLYLEWGSKIFSSIKQVIFLGVPPIESLCWTELARINFYSTAFRDVNVSLLLYQNYCIDLQFRSLEDMFAAMNQRAQILTGNPMLVHSFSLSLDPWKEEDLEQDHNNFLSSSDAHKALYHRIRSVIQENITLQNQEESTAEANESDYYATTSVVAAGAIYHPPFSDSMLQGLQNRSEIESQNVPGSIDFKSAIKAGRPRVLHSLLDQGAKVNVLFDHGSTPLHFAAIGGHDRIVQSLLDAGAHVNAVDVHGLSVLHFAALGRHFQIVRLLLGAGADVNVADDQGLSVLHLAAMEYQHGIMQLLINAGSDVNSAGDDGLSALHFATMKNDFEITQLLIDSGADLNAVDDHGLSALHYAIMGGEHRTIQLLVDAGADVNLVDKALNSPLHLAAWLGRLDTVRLLHKSGADINARDLEGFSPLARAIESGKSGVISYLVTVITEMTLEGQFGIPLEPSDLNGALLQQCILSNDKELLMIIAKWNLGLIVDRYPWVTMILDESSSMINEVLDLVLKSENLQWLPPGEYPPVNDRLEDFTTGFKHLDQCAHNYYWLAFQNYSPSVLPSNPLDSEQHFCELDKREKLMFDMCGIGGVFPPDYHNATLRLNPGYIMMARRMASVTYGPSPEIARKSWLESSPTYVLTALQNVVSAMKALHEESGCCDRITIIVKPYSRRQVVELVTIYIWELIEMQNILEKTVLSADDLESSNLADYCRKMLKRRFLDVLMVGAFVNLDSDKTLRNITCLHICAIIIQMVSIGLVTFSRGHSREFYTEMITRPVETFVLRGLAETGIRLFAQRVRLSCMGQMLGREVWMFHNRFADSVTKWESPFFLSAAPDDIVDTWGGYISIPDLQSKTEIRLHTGGGIIYPTMCNESKLLETDEIYCHWSTEIAASDIAISIPPSARLLVGATSPNEQCPLTRQTCQSAISHALKELGTRQPSWKLTGRNIGGSVGHSGATVNVGATQTRDDGRTCKQVLIDNFRQSKSLLILNSPWGLELSFCTWIARRVALRHLMYGEALQYLARCLAGTWNVIAGIATEISTMTEDQFGELLLNLSKEQTEALEKAVEHLILAMESTGVDKQGEKLTLWWPERNQATPRGIELLKSQYASQNPWIPILKDSDHCAVFAMATSRCLQHDGIKTCRHASTGALGDIATSNDATISIPAAIITPTLTAALAPTPLAPATTTSTSTTQNSMTLEGVRYVILDTKLGPADQSLAPSYEYGETYLLWKTQHLLKVDYARGEDGQIVNGVVRLGFIPGGIPRILTNKNTAFAKKVEQMMQRKRFRILKEISNSEDVGRGVVIY